MYGHTVLTMTRRDANWGFTQVGYGLAKTQGETDAMTMSNVLGDAVDMTRAASGFIGKGLECSLEQTSYYACVHFNMGHAYMMADPERRAVHLSKHWAHEEQTSCSDCSWDARRLFGAVRVIGNIDWLAFEWHGVEGAKTMREWLPVYIAARGAGAECEFSDTRIPASRELTLAELDAAIVGLYPRQLAPRGLWACTHDYSDAQASRRHFASLRDDLLRRTGYPLDAFRAPRRA